jgi:hypothetical protein
MATVRIALDDLKPSARRIFLASRLTGGIDLRSHAVCTNYQSSIW